MDGQVSFEEKGMLGRRSPDLELLGNLLRDTSPPTLAILARRYGLEDISRLDEREIVERILHDLSEQALAQLENELIAARYGAFGVQELLGIAFKRAAERATRTSRPQLGTVSPGEATLLQDGPPRWRYAIRDHNVLIDLSVRCLACDCKHFEFARRQGMLCKHLAMAFTLMPTDCAHAALTDLLATEQYGGLNTPRWTFSPIQR